MSIPAPDKPGARKQDPWKWAALPRHPYPGTLRQWYAGQALTGILARPCDHKRTAEQRAAEARQHADAMIEARI